MLDYHKLKEIAKFNELPETFVVFITEHDVLKGDKQIYHVERVVRETNKTFKDGTHIIYVNGNIRCGSLLGDLMHDFFCTNPEDMIHRQLAKRVAFLKNNEQEARKMCELMEDLQDEREKETLINSIRNLMETLNLSLQQAMDALKIPVDKQKEYAPLI